MESIDKFLGSGLDYVSYPRSGIDAGVLSGSILQVWLALKKFCATLMQIELSTKLCIFFNGLSLRSLSISNIASRALFLEGATLIGELRNPM